MTKIIDHPEIHTEEAAMTMPAKIVALFVVVAMALSGIPVHAAVVAAPGYAVHAIATPGTVQGGIVRRSGAILVGQGRFGGGTESIVRLDGATTTIASGFNSLGGLDLDVGGTLYAGDNGAGQPGATTGGTLFAIPNALTRTDAVTAAGHEAVPKGSIPFAQDVLVLPDGSVLVSDAAGPGAGRVVHVAGGVASNLITGLDFTGGLALTAAGTLLVDDVNASLVGAVFKYTTAGAPLGTLASHLSGAFDAVVDEVGNVLVSGGTTADGTSSTVIAIAPDGTVTERAHGFVFSTEMYFDATRAEVLVLDSGATAITAICRDRDANGVCDADQACTEPVALVKPRLRLRHLGTAEAGTLRLRGAMVAPFPFSPPLDPLTKGVRVVLTDTAATILDATVPGGAFDRTRKTGWKVNAAHTAWTYLNGRGGTSGVVKVTVKSMMSTPGLLKFTVIGKRGNYAVASGALPVTATMVIDSPHARTGQCGAETFSGSPSGAGCAFDSTMSTLRCK